MSKQPDMDAASLRLGHINALADLVISADQATGAGSFCDGTLSATMAMIMDEVYAVHEALGLEPATAEDEEVQVKRRAIICADRSGEEATS